MKTIKLFKLITTIPLAGIVSAAPLTLCQCNKASDEPTVPSSIKDKVNITTTTDKDGNKVSTLSTKKTTDTITDISVSIGSQKLSNDEYKVEGLTSNSSSITVTIYKATLDKYTGTITITPSIHSEEAKLKSIEATCSKSFHVGDYIKSNDIIVKGKYSDDSTYKLTWNESKNGYTIKDPDNKEINNFSSTGYKFESKGNKTFTVLSKDDPTITPSTFTVSVTNLITISFTGINGKPSKTSMQIEEGKTWGSIKSSVSATAEYGYKQDSLVWKVTSPSTEELTDSTVLTNGMKICAHFTQERDTKEITNPKICDTLNTKVSPGYNSYIPSENVNIGASYDVKGIQYTNDSRYTFKIVLDENDISNVYYFYVVQLYSSTYKLINLQKLTKSIVSIQHITTEETTSVNYELTSYNKGTYITFDNKYSTGTIAVTIEFHEDNYLPLSLIPIFDATK